MGFFDIFSKKKHSESQITDPKSVYRFSGGSNINPDTAMEVAAYFRGVIYISTQIAKLPWEVKDKDNKVLADNPVNRMLKLSPNTEMNTFMWRSAMLQSALNYGNGYAEIERTPDGRPVAIWLLDPSRVQTLRTASGELVYRVLSGSWSNPGGDVYLPARDMFHLRNFHTKDGITGQGLPAYAYETLGTAAGASKFANNLFANGGMPSGVLSAPSTLSDEAFLRLKESWKESHGGRKTGGTAILEEGLSYNAISFAPEVMQFLESRKFSVIEIARFLGLPPTKLFDTENSTYNNIEHSNLEVATDTLDAWAKNFELEADVKLLNSGWGGYKTEMDLYAIFRGDMNTRSQYFTRRMQAGSMTPNEIRIKEGDAPYDGGDRYYIATNNFTPADRVDEVLDSSINKEKSDSESEDKVDNAIVNFLQHKTKQN